MANRSDGSGYMMSGRNVAAHQDSVNVIVHNFPMPTAQITVLTFEDNQPINAGVDQPAEHGLANFQLIFTDPTGGQVMQDAWANPVGMTYKYKIRHTAGRLQRRRPRLCGWNPLRRSSSRNISMMLTDFRSWTGRAMHIYTCAGSPLRLPAQITNANRLVPHNILASATTACEAVIRYLAANKYTAAFSIAGRYICNPFASVH